jgi:exonuclease III
MNASMVTAVPEGTALLATQMDVARNRASSNLPLHVIGWNVQWLNGDRVEELSILFDRLKGVDYQTYDVIILLEVHLLQKELSRIVFDGYRTHGSLPTDKRVGGIIILVRDSIKAHVVPTAHAGFVAGRADALCLRFPTMVPPIWVAGLYCPNAALDFPQFLNGVSSIFDLAAEAQSPMITFGDLNVHDVYPTQAAPWERLAPSQSPAPGKMAKILLNFLEGDRYDPHSEKVTITQRPTWTRAPQGGQRHQRSEIDYMMVSKSGLGLVIETTVIDTSNSIFGEVQTDHRPLSMVLAIGRGDETPAPPLPRPPPRRTVDWGQSSEEQHEAFALLIGPRCDQMSALIVDGIAKGCPLLHFRSDIEFLLTCFLTMLRQTEDEVIGSRFVYSGRHFSGPTWRTEAVRMAHDMVLECHRGYLEVAHVTGPVSPGTVAAAWAALIAARELFAVTCREAQAAAAVALLLCVPPGGHQSKRLHAMLRAIVHGGPLTDSTHTFFEFQIDGSPDVCCIPSEIEELISTWMYEKHKENPDDVSFHHDNFVHARKSQTDWERWHCSRECAGSRETADQTARWELFDQTVDAHSVASVSSETWVQALSSDIRPSEVKEAISSTHGDVSPSPDDGVVYSALKHGGAPLWRLLALIFSVVIDLGAVPQAWSCGFIRWLFKGKGSKLDPSNFRGITLTSCIGKTFERVLHRRLVRWSRFIGAIPLVQSVSQAKGGVLEQIGTLADIIALRAAQFKCTWVLTVDLKGAFPSASRLFLWHRLRQLGLGGAILRVLMKLFTNDACVGGLQGGRFSRRVLREMGVPEGFVLSPFLFALAISGLVPALVATGVGVKIAQEFAAALFYVDDVALLADSFEELQILLRVTVEWCYQNRFTIHPDKFEAIVAGHDARNAAALFSSRFSCHFVFDNEAPDFTLDIKIGDSLRYLGPLFAFDLKWDLAIARWQKNSASYVHSIAAAMSVLGDISRSSLLSGFTSHARMIEEWSAPTWGSISPSTWKLLMSRDHYELRRLLGEASFLMTRLSAAILLDQLPFEIRIAYHGARHAFRHDGLRRESPLHFALFRGLSDAPFAGMARSSAYRSDRSLRALHLEWPTPPTWTKNSWKTHVRRAAHSELWRQAADHPSMTLLCLVRPSKLWLKRWILDRPARGDSFSDVVIAVLGGKWRLFTETRTTDPHNAFVCDCDHCTDSHPGDAASTLLLCPLLERWRTLWLQYGSQVALVHGPDVLSWWQETVGSAAPSTVTLAASIFAIGAPVACGFAFENLQHELTSAFATAFAPFYEEHVVAMRSLRWYRPQTTTLGAADDYDTYSGPDNSADIDDIDLADLDEVVNPEICPDDVLDDEDDFFDDYLGGPIEGL